MEIPDIEPKKAEPFFRMNFAQALTVGTVILGMLWTVFGYGRDISDNAKRIEQVSADLKAEHKATQDQIASINARVERMDTSGTIYGKTTYSAKGQQDESTIKRVERLEESINSLKPTVTQMATNLEWISGWVKVQSQQPVERSGRK